MKLVCYQEPLTQTWASNVDLVMRNLHTKFQDFMSKHSGFMAKAERRNQLLQATHHPIMVNTYNKLFPNPSIKTDDTDQTMSCLTYDPHVWPSSVSDGPSTFTQQTTQSWLTCTCISNYLEIIQCTQKIQKVPLTVTLTFQLRTWTLRRRTVQSR